jgi:hypothetical protein
VFRRLTPRGMDLYAQIMNASINDWCKIRKNTFGICVNLKLECTFPVMCYIELETDAWCLSEIEYLWFDNI